jgi:hypothetical protein
MLALLSLVVASAVTEQPSPSGVPSDAAIIVNTGSTNTRGYRIIVRPNGQATVQVEGEPPRHETVEAATSTALFKDLAAAAPLDKLPSEPCMKSASFGSTTYVQFNGKRSPDLSCPMEGIGNKLADDVRHITEDLHVLPAGRVLRRTLSPQPEVPGPLTPPPKPTPS